MQCRWLGSDSWVGKSLCRWKRQPAPVLLPGEYRMDRGAWRATVPGVTRVGHDWVTKPLKYERKQLNQGRRIDSSVWRILLACVYKSREESIPKKCSNKHGRTLSKIMAKKREPDVKHEPHSKMSSDGRTSRRSRPRKKRKRGKEGTVHAGNATKGLYGGEESEDRRAEMKPERTKWRREGGDEAGEEKVKTGGRRWSRRGESEDGRAEMKPERRKWRQEGGDEAGQVGPTLLPLHWCRPERALVRWGSSGTQQRLRKDKRSLKRQQEGVLTKKGLDRSWERFPPWGKGEEERRAESKETLESGVQSYEFLRKKLLIILCG